MDDYRKRLRRFERAEARYLTFSCHQRLPLLNHPEWRNEFVRGLVCARQKCQFQLMAWVVMPEHVHVIIAPRVQICAVPGILGAIKQPIAQTAIRKWKAMDAPILNRLLVSNGSFRYWQAGGGFDRNVRDIDELHREIRYINENPVRRGLVADPVDWEWSSARWYAGQHDGTVPIDDFRM